MENDSNIIRMTERTSGGSLSVENFKKIADILFNGGAILLPSDTCYSLAFIPNNRDINQKINIILDRPNLPISLSFSNCHMVERYVNLDNVSEMLLNKFTPGCITIICKANYLQTSIPLLTNDIVRSQDGTIGVRIPDSQIEREVSSTVNSPLTTVAVRESGAIVQDFDKAYRIIKSGIDKLSPNTPWIAIEGVGFSDKHSTVLRVDAESQKVTCERDGDISFNKIQEALNQLSFRVVEQNEVSNIIKRLRKSVLVNQDAVNEIEKKLLNNEILDLEAINELQRIERLNIDYIFLQSFEDEWKTLDETILTYEEQIKKSAKGKLNIGLVALPFFIFAITVFIFMVDFFFNHKFDSAIYIILGSFLGSIVAYTFFILRIQQQYSTAAERLVEKRIGTLFLRIAIGLKDDKRSDKLINAGTSMYLGHYAPNTIPLSHEDISSTSSMIKK